DAAFKKYYETPILAAVINKLYKLDVPEKNRDDLVAVLLTGVPKLNFTGTRPADLLRLNRGIPPTHDPRAPRSARPAAPRRPRREKPGLAERPPARRRRDRHRRAGRRRLPQGDE